MRTVQHFLINVHPALLLLMWMLLLLLLATTVCPCCLPSSIKKLFKQVKRCRLHFAADSTEASVVNTASVRRHRPTLLLLIIILPLLPMLLSSIKTLPKLGPQRHWRFAASFYSVSMDAAAAVCHHRPPLLLLMIIPPLLTTLLSSVINTKLEPRHCQRHTVGSTTASVDAAADVCRHHPLMLLLAIIPSLAQLLLSSIEKLPKLVQRHRRCLAAGSTATPVDASVDAAC